MKLTDDQKRQVATDVRARFPEAPLPDRLTEWLADYLPRAVEALGERYPDRQTVGQVAAVAAMSAYGPTDAGPPPDDLLWRLVNDFAAAVDWQSSAVDRVSLERRVERALVFGLARPANSGGPPEPPGPPVPGEWARRWPGSWAALLELIRRQIAGPVRWIGARVFGYTGGRLNAWAYEETFSCAALLRGALVIGPCRCWERWADLGIGSEAIALGHCAGHTLFGEHGWDPGRESLNDFVFRVGVHGALRLGGEDGPERVFVNDFRRGMLAKEVGRQELMAGYVLMCGRKTGGRQRCGGEIGPDDRCDRCGEQAVPPKDPSWRLWRKGTRRPAACWRCRGCDALYFQTGGGCPRGHNDWATHYGERCCTRVWVPTRDVAFDERAWATPPADPVAGEEAERLAAAVERLPEGHRVAARRLFVERVSAAAVAEELGMDPDRARFKNLVQQVYQALKAELGEQPGGDDPSGGDEG